MRAEIPCGKDMVELDFDVPEHKVKVAQAKCETSSEPMETLAEKALEDPIGSKRLRDTNLKGKSVAILVDDKTRPTPANRIAPIVLDELRKAGVSDKDIFLVTAEQRIKSRLGREIADRYKVIIHDRYHGDRPQFIGFNSLGTPVWINKAAAKADYRVAIGRICPHSDTGYEGEGKMILLGICSMESVMHNHCMCCSPKTGLGTFDDNPRWKLYDMGNGVRETNVKRT